MDKNRRVLIRVVITASILWTPVQTFGFQLNDKLNNLIDSRQNTKITLDKDKTKVIVFFNFLKGCPIVKKYLPEMRRIKKKYESKALIIIIDSSANAELESKETLKYLVSMDNNFPVVIDYQSELALQLKLTTASEVAVIDTRDFSIKYKGSVDDRVTLNFDRAEAQHRYLEDKINNILDGKDSQYTETEAQGCRINLFQKK
ncbi:MAG: redoxin family protein [Pseudobdellovibrio sp.]